MEMATSELIAIQAIRTYLRLANIFYFYRSYNIYQSDWSYTIIEDMWTKIKGSLSLNLMLMVIAGVVGASVVRMASQGLGLYAEVRGTEARATALERKKVELIARLAELDTPEVIERVAKARLNLKNQGERVVVVTDEQESHTPVPPASFWQKVKRFLRGIF